MLYRSRMAGQGHQSGVVPDSATWRGKDVDAVGVP